MKNPFVTKRARRFVLTIKSKRTPKPWTEEYYTTSPASVDAFGTAVVEFFNATLSSNEHPRTYVSGVDHGYTDVEPHLISKFEP